MPTVDDYYRNTYQYGLEDYTTSTPEGDVQAVSYAPGYALDLLALRQKVLSGQATAWEREWYQQQADAAMAIQPRDVSTLTYDAGEQGPGALSGGSPDLGNLMLTLQGKIEQGTATPQERDLFQTTYTMLADQNWRASVPQASDAFSPMGDNLLSALGVLALGATGGMAAAPLAAGGATLATTLGSLGTLAGVAGTGAGVLGQATDQDWLSQLGLGLGIAGGVAGGLGGLANLWGTGVQSLSDAARLAQSAGKITGSLGRIPGADPLKDVSRYLGYAGQAGQLGAGVGADDWLGWSGDNAPLAQNVAPNVQHLLSAADMVTQRGGGDVADFSYEDFLGWGDPTAGDPWNSPMPADTPGWEAFTGWGGDERQTGWYQNADLDPSGDASGGGWLNSVLGGLGAAGKFLGANASWLGPAASTLGSLGAGAIGANASRNASGAQAAALNRGIDLQTAQWLQSQANQAPWLQAGQQALGHLTGRMAWEGPQQPGATPAISGANYALPAATPGWTPQTYAGYTPGAVPQASQYGYQGPAAVQAGDYRWTPGQGPRAQDYRYTPGQMPDASQYTYTPGAVPTLSGQELLANDPGVAFRLAEGRKALEGSAAAKGGLLSGPTLAALQRQGQELSSQEYSNAFARAAQQAQMREQWQQQATGQNFGQAMSAAQLREQVQQIASQQGWSQSQAEAAFREAMASQSSQQGFAQALGAQAQQWQQGMAGQQFDWQRAMQEAQQREQGQQFGWQAGTQAQQLGQREQQQYETDRYNRMLGQSTLRYGQDVTQNQTDYQRQQQAYAQQVAELQRQWGNFAQVAGLGQGATNQLGASGQTNATQMASLLGQLGTAQAGGTVGGANSWMNALQNVGGAVQGGLANQQLLSVLSNLNR